MLSGMMFSARAAATMGEQFEYSFHHFPKTQKAVFRNTCKEVRANGGTELDAVCVFMVKIADSIFEPKEHAEMIDIWMAKVRALAPQLTGKYAEELDERCGNVLEKMS